MIAKKIKLLLLIIVFSLSSTNAFAEDLLTGQEPEQNNIVTEDSTGIDLNSEVTPENNIVMEADTGGNTVENSSVIDNFSSGDILGQTTAVKDSNSSLAIGSQIGVKSSESDSQVNADDFNSPDSIFVIGQENPTVSSDNEFLRIDSEDEIDLKFNTGENTFNRNTYIEEAETGDINFAANLVNINNLVNPELIFDLDIYTILGDFVGDVIIEDEFINESPVVEIFQSGEIASSQESISSEANFDMNTGDNLLSDNSLVGDVSSGDANAGYFQNDFAGLLSKANFFILNVLGDWTGENLLSSYDNVIVNKLGTLGSESTSSTINSENQSIIEQDTTFNASANTGRNNFRENTYIGKLTTGNINLMESILNLKPNLRSLKNKLNIRILNILGNWTGNLVKAQTTCPGSDCPINPECPGNVCPVTSPTATPSPEIMPSIETPTTLPAENSQEVLGVSDVIEEEENIVLGESSVFNPGEIEAGTNVLYLAYLLPLIPALLVATKYRKP